MKSKEKEIVYEEKETVYDILKGETLRNIENVKEIIEKDEASEEVLDDILYEMRRIQDIPFVKYNG